VVSAAAGVALSGLALQEYLSGAGASQTDVSRINQRVHNLNVASLVCYSIAAVAGLTWGWTKLWPGVELNVDGATDGRSLMVGFRAPL